MTVEERMEKHSTEEFDAETGTYMVDPKGNDTFLGPDRDCDGYIDNFEEYYERCERRSEELEAERETEKERTRKDERQEKEESQDEGPSLD